MKGIRNWIKKKIWRILIIAVILGVGAWYFFFKDNNANLQTDIVGGETVVALGSLKETLVIDGTTQFADAQKLTFANQGKVQKVNVQVGDEVKKGQILAQISTDDLDSNIEQAQIALDNAKLDLKQLEDNYNLGLELLQAQASYDSLLLKKATIDQEHKLTQDALDQQTRDKQKDYDDAVTDYNELLQGQSSSTNQDLLLGDKVRERNATYQNAILGIKEVINSIQSSLDDFDKTMKMTNQYKYEGRDSQIGAKNMSAVNASEVGFWGISSKLSSLQQKYNTLNAKTINDVTNEEILDAYALIREIGNDMVDRGNNNYQMFKDSIEGGSYTATKRDGDMASALKVQSSGISNIQKYSSMVDTLAKIKDDTSVEDAKIKYEKLKTELDKLLLQKQSQATDYQKDLASLEDQLETAQRNLNKIKGGESLNEEKIRTAKNTIKQRESTLSNYLKKYEDYRIEANFDGIVTQMDMQVGDTISNSSNATQRYVYVETPDLLEMLLSADQVDIVKLKVGMPVDVYLDAYPNEIYKGVITIIDTIPTSSSSSVTTYEVTVAFQKNNPSETILAGMKGNANIVIKEVSDVIVIPSQAISSKDGKTIVKIYKNNLWEDQEVELGMANANQTEVTSGLNVGDKIKLMYMTKEGMENSGIYHQDPEEAMMNARSDMENGRTRGMNDASKGGGGGAPSAPAMR